MGHIETSCLMLFIYMEWIIIYIGVKAQTIHKHVKTYLNYKDKVIREHIMEHLQLITLLSLAEIVIFILIITSIRENIVLIKLTVLFSLVLFDVYLFRHFNCEIEGWFKDD